MRLFNEALEGLKPLCADCAVDNAVISREGCNKSFLDCVRFVGIVGRY